MINEQFMRLQKLFYVGKWKEKVKNVVFNTKYDFILFIVLESDNL